VGQKYDVIVVGTGPNGVTAGAYLAKAGARVLLLERRHETGGGLVTEEFRGFRFNLHAIHMMMMEVTPPYHDLDLEGYGCRFIKPEAQVSLLTRDGKSVHSNFSEVNSHIVFSQPSRPQTHGAPPPKITCFSLPPWSWYQAACKKHLFIFTCRFS